MPGRTLPTLPTAQVASHNTAKSCYVTVGTKVYDITPFLDDHPGGADLVLEYGGKDVTEIMEDEVSHTHSESAWEILDEHLIGFVATDDVMEGVKESQDPFSIVPMEPSGKGMQELEKFGRDGDVKKRDQVEVAKTGEPLYKNTGMSNEEDLSKETDTRDDYKKHKFLDLSRPLFMQVWNGGFDKDFYLEQVHRPRHYKGGDSAPLFGNFLEPLTKTPWYVVPTFWLPPVIYGTYLAATHFNNPLITAAYWMIGLGIWTIVEYGLHRCLFHLDENLPNNRVAITAHFLLHGIHHYLPMDQLRLVMPPTLFFLLQAPVTALVHKIMPAAIANGLIAGAFNFYVLYDCMHYAMHHSKLPSYLQKMKKYHLAHHYQNFELGFGVTSKMWDWVFNTQLQIVSK